jgi:endonuclease G
MGTRVFSLVVVFFAFTGSALAGPVESCQEYAKYGVPGNEGTLLCRKGHLLAHDSYYKTPVWVAEHLTKDYASGTISRSNKFAADPDLPEGERAELSDYSKSGYDRGHMAPAADMKWNNQAMKQCFYLSNMVPQAPKMNQIIWNQLEGKVRQWAMDRGELYIYTGPIYHEEEVEVIGDNEVGVPTHIFKIVYDPLKVEAIAFIMPNEPLDPADMDKYIVSVREVEDQTGLDFLSTLKGPVQDIVETEKQSALW